jgi:lipid-A-disaccharide synthase
MAEADILARRPSALVTIDVPSFALRLAGRVRPRGVRVVHYVAPQVWAWRPWRVAKLRERVDRVLALLPFEPVFFEAAGVPVRFVGHPVVESGVDGGDAARFRAAHGMGAAERPVVVMPGSRRGEIGRLLGIFGEALRLAAREVPELRPALPIAAPVEEAVRAGTSAWPVRPVLLSDAEARRDGYAAAEAGLIKSGTSSLEMAVAGVPHVVGYRVNPVTAAIVRRLIQIPHASLVNLLAQREVVPERLQENCTPERLAAELVRLLREPEAAAAQRAAFAEVVGMLRPACGLLPSEAAAEAVLEVVEG